MYALFICLVYLLKTIEIKSAWLHFYWEKDTMNYATVLFCWPSVVGWMKESECSMPVLIDSKLITNQIKQIGACKWWWQIKDWCGQHVVQVEWWDEYVLYIALLHHPTRYQLLRVPHLPSCWERFLDFEMERRDTQKSTSTTKRNEVRWGEMERKRDRKGWRTSHTNQE